MMGSKTVQWETPADLFKKLDDEFHFTVDVCASDGMQKCPRYYNPQTDGLKQEWGGGGSMLDESPLWQGHNGLGQKGGNIPSDHRGIVTSQDRYQVVSTMGTAIRIGSTFHIRTGQVRWFPIRGTVPVHHSDMEYTKNTEIRNDRLLGSIA